MVKKEQMSGGNVHQTYKLDDKVYRNTSGNPNIHLLLQHLQHKNFSYTPKFFGVVNNQEVLSYIPGYVPGDKYPSCPNYIWSTDNLIEAAKILRQFHDLTVDFLKNNLNSNWELNIFSEDEQQVICHNDFAPYNFVYMDTRIIGLIDFDMVSPGPRIFDIAYALYTIVPLSSFQFDDRGNIRKYQSFDALIRRQRINLFFEAYQMPRPDNLKQWIIRRLIVLCDYIDKRAKLGNKAFEKMKKEGTIEYYRQEINFIEQNFDDW